MELEFEYDLRDPVTDEFLAELAVIVDVEAYEPDDGQVRETTVHRYREDSGPLARHPEPPNWEEIDISSLPKEDQKAIEDKAHDLAAENAWEAYQERLDAEADKLVDLQKEGEL